jgi:hypothetical protein
MAALVFWPSYSSCNDLAPYHGTTGNAASNGHNWSMSDVLPTPPGLEINGVIYNYIIQKNVNDSVNVHVQNENADGTGYIFRETDQWKAGSLGGTEIRKAVPVIPGIGRDLWGDGSIEVEGPGSVEDANVIYTYKVDPCYDPQFNPGCPGYVPDLPDPFNVDELYSLLNESIELADNETDLDIYDDEEESSEEDEEDEEREKMRLEAALSAVDNSEMFANAFAQAQILAAMNNAIQMSNYYAGNVPGGEYKDSQVLIDKKIDDNKKGLRNGLAQQLLHEEMVSMQYTN